MTEHVHNAWLCPAHPVPDCGCPDPENELCNPYYQSGFCPDDVVLWPPAEEWIRVDGD